MSDNPQQWNEHSLYMGEPGQTPAAPSNGSYSPHSTTSSLSSSSHGSYYWAPGTVPFDTSLSPAWASPLQNSATIEPLNGPIVQHHGSHSLHGPHHVGCHSMGIICQNCSIIHEFRDSTWRRMHEMEPRDPNSGRSILLVLLAELPDPKGGRIYACRICEELFTRPDRAVTHLRHKHLDHRPYACQGRCGTHACTQRFHSQENLTPHINPKTVDCHYCDHKCLRQNIKRHIQRYHGDRLEG